MRVLRFEIEMLDRAVGAALGLSALGPPAAHDHEVPENATADEPSADEDE